jgi:hypothetical protein
MCPIPRYPERTPKKAQTGTRSYIAGTVLVHLDDGQMIEGATCRTLKLALLSEIRPMSRKARGRGCRTARDARGRPLQRLRGHFLPRLPGVTLLVPLGNAGERAGAVFMGRVDSDTREPFCVAPTIAVKA